MNKLLQELEILKSNLDKLNTEDMNNGFAKQGSLYSPRIENLIKPIENFAKHICPKLNRIIAFTDSHTESSIELLNYPIHCLEDSIESDIVDELKDIPNLEIIQKNSTNGFFALNKINFENIDNIIIVGDCTDICIYQFAITLKSYFNQNNLRKNIIVPINLVDTYDIPNVHNAELLNIVFLNSMIQNGINVVKEILY